MIEPKDELSNVEGYGWIGSGRRLEIGIELDGKDG